MSRRCTSVLGIVLGAALLTFVGCESVANWGYAASSPMNWSGKTRIELPLRLHERGWPLISVQVSGRDATAILDSGAPTSMSPELLAAADIQSRRLTINGQGRDTQTTKGHVPFGLGPGSIEIYRVHVYDHPSDRLVSLGRQLFLQAVVEFDFDAGRLTLTNPDDFTPPAEEPVRVKSWKSLPTVQISINGTAPDICAAIDTGFNGGIALSDDLVRKLNLPKDPARGVFVAYDVFGKRHEAPSLAPLKQVQIGELHYRDIPVAGTTIVEEDCGNLVGMAVLRRHRVIFDLPNQRLWLLPRIQEG
jgi:hypothetical protein